MVTAMKRIISTLIVARSFTYTCFAFAGMRRIEIVGIALAALLADTGFSTTFDWHFSLPKGSLSGEALGRSPDPRLKRAVEVVARSQTFLRSSILRRANPVQPSFNYREPIIVIRAMPRRETQSLFCNTHQLVPFCPRDWFPYHLTSSRETLLETQRSGLVRF